MSFDIRTVILILGISHLMQVLVFSHLYSSNKSILGPGWWLMWSAAESIAFILMLLRSIPSILPIVIIFQDILVLAGTTFIYLGVLRFFEKRINLKFILLLILSFTILHLFFFLVVNNIEIRVLLLDIYLSVVAFLTAISLYKNKTSSIASSVNFNIVIFIVHGSIFAYRSVMILLGYNVENALSPTVFNLFQYFDALIVSLMWTFGFIMMLNQRLNSEIFVTKTHFEQIFKTSPDAVAITRLNDGLFVDCNENFTKIFGLTKENITGKSTIEINLWKNTEDRQKIVNKINEIGFCENHESLFFRKNGEVFNGLISANKINLKGTPHIISVTRDISELKAAQEEVKLKNEELHKINAVKDRLFSTIGHDLRSPFTTIMGYSDLLLSNLNKYPKQEIEEMILTIQNTSKHTYRLLENLLNWAKNQTGEMPVNFIKADLNHIIQDAIDFSIPQAVKKNIIIDYISIELPTIVTDENIVNTVLRNLISNAIKFTNQNGKISLKAIKRDNCFEVAVSDNGIGMTSEIKNGLFLDFIFQSQRGTEHEKGTGLGLTICKEFINKIGGEIWVESELAKGSVFYFTIPIRS